MRSHYAHSAIVVLCLVLPALAWSQSPPPLENAQWISLEGQSEPGAPASVNAIDGGAQFTTVEVKVPGFWLAERLGPDQQVYQEVFFPGLGQINQPGAPKLPAVQMRLALPAVQAEVQLAAFEVENQTQVQEVQRVWPQPVPERDFQFDQFDLSDEDGEPEQFLFDEQIYSIDGLWPFPNATGQAAGVDGGAIPEVVCVAYPCKFNPTTGEFVVASTFRVTFQYGGGGLPQEPLTLERARIAELRYLNWELVRDSWIVNDQFFEADYLFVFEEELRPNLLPLIDQKKARGYLVSEIYLENVGNTCDDIRTAIQDWYALRPSNRDKYCLLVGDTDVIPQCSSPMETYTSGIPTDDVYASTNGIDLDEEIYLGRLSIDGAEDLDTQVSKLLGYMDAALLFTDFRRVGLVANKEEAPGKYVGAHESVRLASYANPPLFTTFYGDDVSVSDADVSNFIESGVGLVAYRGHGNTNAWTNWNTSGEYYTQIDVAALTNGPAVPVIWSFACTNSNLDSEDCLGERWLETTDAAVSHYGASVPSYTTPNHELDRAMFRAVYDYGLTKQSHAIESAEAEMAAAHYNDNAWMYNLLGDPDMDIRRDTPPAWTVNFPEVVDPGCSTCPYEFSVLNEQGNPIENVLVSVFQSQAGLAKRADDFQENGYTDGGGAAVLDLGGVVEGQVRLVFRSLDGEVFNETITASDATSAPSSSEVSLRLSASPSLTNRATTFHFGAAVAQEQTVRVFDLRGRAVRELRVGAGRSSLAWDGRDDQGRAVGSGVYMAKMVADGRVLSTRVTIVR